MIQHSASATKLEDARRRDTNSSSIASSAPILYKIHTQKKQVGGGDVLWLCDGGWEKAIAVEDSTYPD